MNESRAISFIDRSRKILHLAGLAGMIVGLFFSRAVLSASMIIFIGNCVVHRHLARQLKSFLSSPFLWSMTGLFLIPFVSGLWTDDVNQWLQILRIKLPLLLLPFCFCGIHRFVAKDWERVALVFLIATMIGICVSVFQYTANWQAIHAGYLEARTLATPLGNDHVRFSLVVAISVLTATFMLLNKTWKSNNLASAFLIVTIAVGAFYLHLLAVRTGLVCFYLSLFGLAIARSTRGPKIQRYLLLLLFLILPVVAYYLVPTFRNRIKYLTYDLASVRQNDYHPGSNDGNRVASLKAGWQLLHKNPLTGVGFGDIGKEVVKYYDSYNPKMQDADKILPASEWLMYGAGAGWPGLLLFSIVIAVPFFSKPLKEHIAWILLSIFMAFSYLFDIGLEVQYGVFLHAFAFLWWHQWLQCKK